MILIIKGIFTGLYRKIKSTIETVLSDGVWDLVVNRRWIKAIVDVLLWCLWIWCMFAFPDNTYVVTAGVTMILLLINRVFTLSNQGSLFAGFVGPFISMTASRMAGNIFRTYKIIIAVISLFVFPAITREAEDAANTVAEPELYKVPPRPSLVLKET